jgi:hypothetical protein
VHFGSKSTLDLNVPPRLPLRGLGIPLATSGLHLFHTVPGFEYCDESIHVAQPEQDTHWLSSLGSVPPISVEPYHRRLS